MLDALLNYTFMQNAFLAALFASIICGIIGTIITEKKLVGMSGGIAHASFGGIGLGYLLGIEPILGGLFFSVLSAMGVSAIKRKTNTKNDTLIGMLWAFGMALGILFIAVKPGYPPDMTSYLFGDILTVSTLYIKIMVLLIIIIVFTLISFFNFWKSFLFDEEYARIKGINTVLFEYILYIMIALSIVILIKVVGIILVIALMTIPPAISKLFTRKLSSLMIISTLLGIFLSIAGLVVSYVYRIPSGATIIIISVFAYLLAVLLVNRRVV
jgi:zinc transport system permease protein